MSQFSLPTKVLAQNPKEKSQVNDCILKAFWRLSLDFLWKSQPCQFPEVYYFSNNLWCSNYHQSKALVIRNNFCCYNINVKLIFRDTNVKKSSLVFFKNAFLKWFLRSKFLPFLTCLIHQIFYVFVISQKSFENNPHNVYIFLSANARAL